MMHLKDLRSAKVLDFLIGETNSWAERPTMSKSAGQVEDVVYIKPHDGVQID